MPGKRQDRGRILTVDDEESVGRMLQQWLGHEGYAVQCATDFATLRRLMDEHSFDLITLDVEMPGVNGLEVLDWLAKMHPDVGAIMASVQDDLPTVIGAMRKGAISYLLKPFDLELVSQEIGRAMERQRLKAENRAHRLELEWLVAERTRQLQKTRVLLERQVRELEGRDQLARLQMDPPTDVREAFHQILRVAGQVSQAGQAALWRPDRSGAYLERVAVLQRSGTGDMESLPPDPATGRLPIRGTGLLPVRVFRERRPVTGSRDEAATPVLYGEETVAVLQVTGLPAAEGWLDILRRLGDEAALVLRMVQVARDLEREGPQLDTLLRADAPPLNG